MNQQNEYESNQNQIPSLTINDLGRVCNLLDQGVQRGAWKINELEEVSSVYSKISTFIEYQAKAQVAANQAKKAESQEEKNPTGEEAGEEE